MFSSDCCHDDLETQNTMDGDILPKANCQIADPICLSARICDCQSHCNECCCQIPDCICSHFGGQIDFTSDRCVYVTIGIFTIVQIVRNVQMLIPAYDFCIPEKECVTTSDNPCEMFRRIEFPTEEFFPPKVSECGCNDQHNKK